MPSDPKIPSLYEWAGGSQRLEALFTEFYRRVANDATLSPVFAKMGADHPKHVAAFVGEVFGGPPAYTGSGGSHAGMIHHHLQRHLTPEQRKRWVALLIETADAVALPDDPEFRAAFVGYLEWGSRLAMINSAEGVAEPEHSMPMPTWNWGPPGGPYIPK